MRKNLQQSIVKSIGRYLAIVMIIALGAAMFVGLLMTKSDMVATGQKYMEEQNMFDLRLISPYGWDKEHVDKVAQLDGVVDAEGVLYLDAVADHENQTGAVYRFYEIPEKLNKIVLRGGRMPERPDECLADGFTVTDEIIGTKLQITEDNEETTLDAFTTKTFTIVGYVSSPLYMDMNRGNTSIGSGSLASYFYVLPEALDTDYYAEINLVIPGEYDVYTDEFNDAMEAAADRIEPVAKKLVADRVRNLRAEAMEEYEEGLREYEDGLKTYEEEKAKALQELDDAYNKLLEAEDLIAENEQLLEYGHNPYGIAPLREKMAHRLFDTGLRVYNLIPGGGADRAQSHEDIVEHAEKGGYFAIDKGQWMMFIDKKSLEKVEELLEDDYNMIDGIINNGEKPKDDRSEKKTSVMEKLQEKKVEVSMMEKTAPKQEKSKAIELE